MNRSKTTALYFSRAMARHRASRRVRGHQDSSSAAPALVAHGHALSRRRRMRRLLNRLESGTTPAPVILVDARGGGEVSVPHSKEELAVAFKIGDRLVYPNHGVGVVETIQESLLEGSPHRATSSASSGTTRASWCRRQLDRIGLRPLTRRKDVGSVFRVLENGSCCRAATGRAVTSRTSTRCARDASRHRGRPQNLSWVQKQKALSFREKKMYERARYLIVSEIAQINGLPEGEVVPRSRGPRPGHGQAARGEQPGPSGLESV